MIATDYEMRRGEIETYFDRTAAEGWKALTSDVPVSGIRATVRAGRDRMRATLLSWLPDDLTGRRLLDAGCGTGALAIEAARRGADVVAIDLSPTLVAIAEERAASHDYKGRIAFHVGDMRGEGLGHFDHAVAMDALIHYRSNDMTQMIADLAARARRSLIFTFAPRTPALAVMHTAGRLFPRSDRAPAIEPIAPRKLTRSIAAEARLVDWAPARSLRVSSGFYTSEALELVRS